MKKSILMTALMALSAFGSTSLMAQSHVAPAQQNAQPAPAQRPMPSAADRAKRMTDRMNETAQLTPDQYAKVLQINKDFQTQRDAMGSVPRGQMTEDQRNQMRAAGKDREAKIKAVLTPEQWQKIQEGKSKPAPGGHMGQ